MVKRTYTDFNSDTAPPPYANSTRNLERRVAAIEDELARINETIARLVDAQVQHNHQANDAETEKKACKSVANRVGNITGELNKVKREVATISKSMIEQRVFQQDTEAQIRGLSISMEKVKRTTQTSSQVVKEISYIPNSNVGSPALIVKEREVESGVQSRDKSDEEPEKDQERGDREDWPPGYFDVVESLESMSRTLVAEDNARRKEYARLHDGVAETVGKLDGINALLHQQRHTQSRIARNAEKNTEDLTQLVDIVKNLQTAVSEQGKSIDLMLRDETKPETSHKKPRTS